MFTSQLYSQSQIPQDLTENLEENEQGDAKLFKSKFTNKFVYDTTTKEWYKFTGPFWERDINDSIILAIGDHIAADYIQEGARQRIAGNAAKEKECIRRASTLRSRKRVMDAIAWAKPMMSLPKSWDSAPLLLPCANGVVDLQNGSLRQGQPDEYLKLHAPTKWSGLSYPAPNWEKFISELVNGDKEMIAFLQRLLGYSISGLSNEKVMPILYGENGNNGKTTLLETIKSVLGTELTKKESASVLMEAKFSGGEKPSDFIVSLQGKRIVWANESKDGAKLDIGLLKELAGGDTISGRGVYAKHGIQFRPSHVVFLVTNRLPQLNVDDDAAWNRIFPIEFAVSFVDNPTSSNEKLINRKLPELLTKEASGILAWMVRGCIDYQQNGLQPPASILKWRQEYRKSEDKLEEFIAECLNVSDPRSKTSSKIIYQNYRTWAKDNGLDPMSQSIMGKRLKKKNFVSHSGNKGIIYDGVSIKPI
ncbi:MAG: phage/plasmid primase, P4 family [Chloroflexota bacterium]